MLLLSKKSFEKYQNNGKIVFVLMIRGALNSILIQILNQTLIYIMTRISRKTMFSFYVHTLEIKESKIVLINIVISVCLIKCICKNNRIIIQFNRFMFNIDLHSIYN